MGRVIEVDVLGVRVEMPTNQPIVLLRERDGERYLPIWIGAAVASVAAYVTSDAVESRLARIRLEAEFEPAMRNMREEILVAADATLFYVANHIAALGSRVTGTTSAPSRRMRATFSA